MLRSVKHTPEEQACSPKAVGHLGGFLQTHLPYIAFTALEKNGRGGTCFRLTFFRLLLSVLGELLGKGEQLAHLLNVNVTMSWVLLLSCLDGGPGHTQPEHQFMARGYGELAYFNNVNQRLSATESMSSS